jgi:hypothetical protein
VPAFDGPIPLKFTGRGRWKAGPLHTFVDDYRQELFWRRPEEGLLVAIAAGVAVAPDFTSYTDDPEPWRQYQAWRSAVIASYWASHGVGVLPVVSFRTGSQGWVEGGSWWAVRSPAAGVDGDQWRRDWATWARYARPAGLVVFGRPLPFDPGVRVEQRTLTERLPARAQTSAAQKEGAGHGR